MPLPPRVCKPPFVPRWRQAAKTPGLVRIVGRRAGVALLGIGAARGSCSRAHATDAWRSSAFRQQLCSMWAASQPPMVPYTLRPHGQAPCR